MLVKFEQNHMVDTTQSLKLFDKKQGFFNRFDRALTLFWKTFLLLPRL